MSVISSQLPGFIQRRSAIRAVIADSDAFRCGFLRSLIITHGAYELVGVAESEQECSAMVAGELPELTICNGAYAANIPQTDPPFPLLVTLGGAMRSERVVCNLDLPFRESQVSEALALASLLIVQQKTRGLWALIDAYLAEKGSQRARLHHIEVEDETGRQLPVSVDDVLWIKAAGNYVQLYTSAGVFELRETISNMADKLEQSGFTRIHRSVVVNDLAVKERRSSSIVLSDGTELMVGPNFRDNLVPGAEPRSSISMSD